MTDRGWIYNREKSFALSVSVEEALRAPAEHIAFQALVHVNQTALGQSLLLNAMEKGVRVSVDAELPVYGLVIPANQTLSGTPHIIISGDNADWANDFGIFIWGHELTHISQIDSRILQNLPSYGVSYDTTAPQFPGEAGNIRQQMVETVLSERMADIIGMGATVQHIANAPLSGLTKVMKGYKETVSLFNAVSEGFRQGRHKSNLCREWIGMLMDLDNFTTAERRYYDKYRMEALPSVSSIFNSAAVQGSQEYLEAQCRMAVCLLGPLRL